MASIGLLLHEESKEGVESQAQGDTLTSCALICPLVPEPPCNGSWCDQKNLFYLVIDMFVIVGPTKPSDSILVKCHSNLVSPVFKGLHPLSKLITGRDSALFLQTKFTFNSNSI